jgi:hypothetical protein
MRGTYEAYILVQVKDGRRFVCALNRLKKRPKEPESPDLRENLIFLKTQVIWN